MSPSKRTTGAIAIALAGFSLAMHYGVAKGAWSQGWANVVQIVAAGVFVAGFIAYDLWREASD